MVSTRKNKDKDKNKNKTRRHIKLSQIVKTIWFSDSGKDKLYLTKVCPQKKIHNFTLDGYYGFTLLYLVYFSYNQNFIEFSEFKSLLKQCSLNTKLTNNINLLELIYLSMFNKKVNTHVPSYVLVQFLQKMIAPNNDFYLYNIFYRKYFTYRTPKYEKLSINDAVIKRANDLLGAGLYTYKMYNNLNSQDKHFLLDIFYTTYIDTSNLIDIHPIIFNFDMYKGFAKKIGENTKDGIRIIIGESLNKLGLLLDLHYKTESYYIPYSKNIYKNNIFTIDSQYMPYLTEEYLKSYKSIINTLLPYSVMKSADKIYICDIIESGKGMLSFVDIFNIIFPEFKHKLHLIFITTIINAKYDLYYQTDNKDAIINKISRDKVKYTLYNFNCNIYILSIFTEEVYNNRCFVSLPIQKIKNKNMNIFQSYTNKINRNNLMKFFIHYKYAN